MAEGFDNENFVSDEVDDTITLLFLGLTRAGKTSIIQVNSSYNFGPMWTKCPHIRHCIDYFGQLQEYGLSVKILNSFHPVLSVF